MNVPDNAVRNAEIVGRRLAGEMPADIRRDMGLSRNIVAGVLNRADLCDADTDKSPSLRKYNRRGEGHPRAKLTEDDVRYIRSALTPYDRGANSGAALARKFGVSETVICWAARRRTWKHVA